MGILDSDIGKSIKKELESEVKREVKKSVDQSVKSVEKAVGINTTSSSKKKSSSSSSSSNTGTSNSAAQILGSLAVGVAGMAVASKINSSDKEKNPGQNKKPQAGKADSKNASDNKEEPISEMAKLAQQAIPRSDAQPVNMQTPEDVPEQITQESASPILEASASSPQSSAEPITYQPSELDSQPAPGPALAASSEPAAQAVSEPVQASEQSPAAEPGGDAEAISDLVKACRLLGCDESEAKERIMTSFSLSDAVASLYIDKFWNV